MLIALPFLTVLVIYLTLLGLQKAGSSRLTGSRVALLQAVLIVGVILALQSEILSLFHILAMPYVAVVWLLAFLLITWYGLRKGWLVCGWKKLVASIQSMDWFTAVTLAAFGLIILVLLVIAVVAPPNNMDSLLYHMSRVMHWAQDRSLAHYPVGFEVQLTHPILAELSILQLRLLWGNDQLANLPQWMSLVLCAIAVSLGAKLLGAGRKGQLAAAAFAISIPIGLLEATSTQNDYVTALWLIILAIFVLSACQGEASRVEVLSIAAALGLGLLTKGTFYPYAAAWGIWLIIHWFRQRKLSLFMKRSLMIVLVVVCLNAGYWWRNTVTYGGPLGPTQWVSDMSSARSGIGSVVSNLVKDILLNFTTPSPRINQSMVSFVQSTFQASDPDANNFRLDWRWNNEDSGGSPIHILLIPVMWIAVVLLIALKRVKDRNLLWYSLAAFFSFIIFVLAAHYDVYGVRFQLPLILVWAPIFGSVVTCIDEKRLALAALAAFFVISLPYVFFNTTRPLIAMKNSPEAFAIHPLPGLGETKGSSIFHADAQTLLFVNASELNKPYMEITNDIRNSGCTRVGLRIDSHDLEYTFWWLLKAPQSGIRVESLYYSDRLERYADPDFKPCAIICTICSGRTRLNGLDLSGSYDGLVNLYAGDGYSPIVDE